MTATESKKLILLVDDAPEDVQVKAVPPPGLSRFGSWCSLVVGHPRLLSLSARPRRIEIGGVGDSSIGTRDDMLEGDSGRHREEREAVEPDYQI